MKKVKGFTLIELMIVIAILGILAAMIMGNFFNSLKKGRDAQRKADLSNIQKAVEMYYEDKNAYPLSLTFGNKLCETDTCASGGKIYMQKLPNDPISNYHYDYNSDGTYFNLYSFIENENDQGQGVSTNGYTNGCGNKCRFTITSPNITPLPTLTPAP